MANNLIFKTESGPSRSNVNAINEAGASAYRFDERHELAQYVMTGCINGTFYASAETQLKRVLELCEKVSPDFIAQLAVYARREGYMKDMPALLCAVLTQKDLRLFEWVAPVVIDNVKMLRNFVQIMRSGVVGRKSLGSAPKRFVREWIQNQSNEALFRGSVGGNPSLADVLKMVHPKPRDEERAAFYAYLLDQPVEAEKLPQLVIQYETFKSQLPERRMVNEKSPFSLGDVLSKIFKESPNPESNGSVEVPKVPFEMLTALSLGVCEWTAIARNAGWHMTRMNLNTFLRHGVFSVKGMTSLIAMRLRDRELIERSKVFPYQIMTAYLNASEKVPSEVKAALHEAMEISTTNVPEIEGQVYVCCDVSGSMHWAITGTRKGSTSKLNCIHVASLISSVLLRKNMGARVLAFNDKVLDVRLDSANSVMKNAKMLSSVPMGGTNCSAPLARLNSENAIGDLVVYVSDNQSWLGEGDYSKTATMTEWNSFKRRNPKARLVCIDIQPNGTTQAHNDPNILNIGGFSDRVFTAIAEFAQGKIGGDHWVKQIENLEI